MEKTKNFLLKSLFACFLAFTLGLVLVQVAYADVAAAKLVGKVTFVTGDVNIVHADKTATLAAKNAQLVAGDAIETKSGRLQLSLIDGGMVSLQPNTIYKINKYEFATGKEDGSEYAFTELIKGGLRTVSGAIGHKNRDRYQLKTAVATIGIRGTEFIVNFNNNKLLMTTNQGSVDVCNAGGCLNALSGQSIGVAGLGLAPKLSDIAAKAAALSPSKTKAIQVVGKEKEAYAAEETKTESSAVSSNTVKNADIKMEELNQSATMAVDDTQAKPTLTSVNNDEATNANAMIKDKAQIQMQAPVMQAINPELEMKNNSVKMDFSAINDMSEIGSSEKAMKNMGQRMMNEKMNKDMNEKMMENMTDLINQSNGGVSDLINQNNGGVYINCNC